jgi:hypothetical protein
MYLSLDDKIKPVKQIDIINKKKIDILNDRLNN